MPPLLRIALKNVLRHRRRSLITFSAIFLALVVMVSIRGLVNGLLDSVRDSIINGQTGALQVHRRGFSTSANSGSLELDVPADQAFLGSVTAVPGVKAVTARIAFGSMINAGDVTSASLITAFEPERERLVCPRRNEMVSAGKTLAEAGPTAAVLTPELAAKLGISLGGRATLLTSDRDGALNALDVDYQGTFGQPGLPLPDKKLGFVPLSLAQELLRMPERATELAVAVEHLDELEAVKGRLSAALGPEYEVATWHEIAPWVDDAIAAYHVVLGVLNGVFLFVAMLGVVNTMLMSVFERAREIGTMMAIGTRRRQILGLFLLEAALLGLCGGTLGAMAGEGVVLALARKGGLTFAPGGMSAPLHIVPSMTFDFVLLALTLATTGAVLAALWPALRASRLTPAQALTSV
jgi:putative ABC transport system permease protein